MLQVGATGIDRERQKNERIRVLDPNERRGGLSGGK
jgi:hypothetical protein